MHNGYLTYLQINVRYIAVGSGSTLTLYSIDLHSLLFHSTEGLSFFTDTFRLNMQVCHMLSLDAIITSLTCNPWPRDIHIAVGLSTGEVKVYNGLPKSHKCPISLNKLEVCRILHIIY